jgi:hypothetical protein
VDHPLEALRFLLAEAAEGIVVGRPGDASGRGRRDPRVVARLDEATEMRMRELEHLRLGLRGRQEHGSSPVGARAVATELVVAEGGGVTPSRGHVVPHLVGLAAAIGAPGPLHLQEAHDFFAGFLEGLRPGERLAGRVRQVTQELDLWFGRFSEVRL